jgi:transposase|tara:strand:+ start:90 stop:1124 length:1035 start_codon:yes stop_codon:yes gene_type:complete
MQIQSLRNLSYKTRRIQRNCISEDAEEKLRKIKQFDRLRAEGCSIETACDVLQVSRATIYRWKRQLKLVGPPGLEVKSKRPKSTRKPIYSLELENTILKLRKQFPFWGKEKIHTILQKQYPQFEVSQSTVGRILKKLIKLGRVASVPALYGKPDKRRARRFNSHAQRLRYGMKAETPGQLIQIDHMSVSAAPGVMVKHFMATCPITKFIVAEAYSNATSTTASRFLEKVLAEMPFEVQSIQVDGGSEFMKVFERSCEARGIPLHILPPRSPKYNGCVERQNGTFRYQFYRYYDGIGELQYIREQLDGFLRIFNDIRPHKAIGNLTPSEYIETIPDLRPNLSHMS